MSPSALDFLSKLRTPCSGELWVHKVRMQAWWKVKKMGGVSCNIRSFQEEYFATIRAKTWGCPANPCSVGPELWQPQCIQGQFVCFKEQSKHNHGTIVPQRLQCQASMSVVDIVKSHPIIEHKEESTSVFCELVLQYCDLHLSEKTHTIVMLPNKNCRNIRSETL